MREKRRIEKAPKSRKTLDFGAFLVPLIGIEPIRSLLRQILSLLRLPVSPQRHILFSREILGEFSQIAMNNYAVQLQ